MSLALTDSLICFEMPIFAIAHASSLEHTVWSDLTNSNSRFKLATTLTRNSYTPCVAFSRVAAYLRLVYHSSMLCETHSAGKTFGKTPRTPSKAEESLIRRMSQPKVPYIMMQDGNVVSEPAYGTRKVDGRSTGCLCQVMKAGTVARPDLYPRSSAESTTDLLIVKATRLCSRSRRQKSCMLIRMRLRRPRMGFSIPIPMTRMRLVWTSGTLTTIRISCMRGQGESATRDSRMLMSARKRSRSGDGKRKKAF